MTMVDKQMREDCSGPKVRIQIGTAAKSIRPELALFSAHSG